MKREQSKLALLRELAMTPSRYAIDAAGMWLKRWQGHRLPMWRNRSNWAVRKHAAR